MVKVSTMSGGYRGVAAVAPALPTNLFFDYSKYTQAELQLLFLMKKTETLQVMYPESNLQSQWQRSINRIENAVFGGVSNFSFTGSWHNDENIVAKAISYLKAEKFSTPANGHFLSNRRNPSVGVDPLIPLEDSYEKCAIYKNNSYGVDFGTCVYWVDNSNYFKTLLNDAEKGLEKASLQFLYSWTSQADLNNDALSFDNRFKMKRHQEHVFELERYTGLSSMNLQGWLSLGIVRQTALKLGTVLTPQEAIAYLKTHLDCPILEKDDPRADGVGFDPFTLIAIAVIILSSFVGISGLIQVTQGREPTAFKYIRDIGSLAASTNSPGGSDWINKTGGGGGGSGGGGGGSGGGGGQTEAQKCAARTGYKWNAATNICELIVPAKKGFDFTDPLVLATGAVVLASGIYLATK